MAESVRVTPRGGFSFRVTETLCLQQVNFAGRMPDMEWLGWWVRDAAILGGVMLVVHLTDPQGEGGYPTSRDEGRRMWHRLDAE